MVLNHLFGEKKFKDLAQFYKFLGTISEMCAGDAANTVNLVELVRCSTDLITLLYRQILNGTIEASEYSIVRILCGSDAM